MRFIFAHNEIHVFDLKKSLEFYKEALGLEETGRHEAKDGSFILVFLSDGISSHKLELTWNRDRDKPYDLGENEIHLAFKVEEFDAAYDKHKAMGCISYENKSMGIYFITDPDGYWLEIIPNK